VRRSTSEEARHALRRRGCSRYSQPGQLVSHQHALRQGRSFVLPSKSHRRRRREIALRRRAARDRIRVQTPVFTSGTRDTIMMSTCSGGSIGAWFTVAKQARDDGILSCQRSTD
jgi:hypothetical protein